MVLSDRDIKKAITEGVIIVDPYHEEMVQPASVDLRLGNKFLTFRSSSRGAIDVREPVDDIMEEVLVEEGVPFVLHPGEYVLGVTFEKVGLSAGIVGQLNGKSSLGRLGIIVHA